jgi:TM2 domain-containing membrane protein YozV
MMLLMKNRLILFVILFTLNNGLKAQNNDSIQAKKDVSFASYLVGSEQFEDAIYFINSIGGNKNLAVYSDTLNYLKGWAFYNLKQLDSAAIFLLKVNNSSFTGEKSHFFAAYNHIYLGERARAEEILQSMPLSDSLLIELRNLELGGVALLNRNFEEYKVVSTKFSHSRYSLTEAENSLDKLHTRFLSYRPKSIFLAGLMSSIIPGSGKMYSGKIGEGVSALLSNAILAGITVENYRKAGPKNFKTIFFGSLFFMLVIFMAA